MLFTIMILSIPSRLDKLKDLMAKLETQIGSREDVEVLCLVDNKKQTIGKKRQNVLNAATGQYVACLYDDDTIADDSVQTLCDAIDNREEPPDVIPFNQHCTIHGDEVMVYFDMIPTQNAPLLRAADVK